MSSSPDLPEGFAEREVQPEEAALVAELVNAHEEAFETGERVSEDDVRAQWRDLGDRGRASLVLDGECLPAAYYEVWPEIAERVHLDGYAHPGFRGRGLGAFVVRAGTEAARPLGDYAVAGTLATDREAHELFAREGWRPLRTFFRMVKDVEAEEAPQPPPALVLRSFEPADAHRFHAAREEAFADHWDHTAESFEEFRRKHLEADDFDATLWWLVLDGEEVAATAECGRRFGMGWVGMLGVRRPWRRRGLGELLLRTAFAELARRGERRVGLGVDAESPTGATRLYERAGMSVAFQIDVFRKDLR
jgi:GNAT superfamily N-acetyltransferase